MAKVSVVRCVSYNRDEVYGAVKRSIDLIGGIGEFVKAGTKVLIKPNLLSSRRPDDAVDTHPEVVRAVVRLVKGAGATPFIGDAPGGYGDNIDEIFEVSGMADIAREEGAQLVKFTTPRFVDGIPIARHVFDCDTMISIPKLKTHCITVLSAGIKNVYGTVTGLYKAECHSRAPKEEDFVKVISKVYSISKPHLTVLDGIIGMEGDGPSSGTPRQMDVVMASRDAVALDSCIARIIGLEPKDILMIKDAYEKGLGEADPAKIETVGDSLDSFMAAEFKLPKTTPLNMIPKPILNTLGNLIKFKPVISAARCKRCNLCKSTCPVNAISSDKGSYRIDYSICVRCLCCHEVCPYRAIDIKSNIFAKLVWG